MRKVLICTMLVTFLITGCMASMMGGGTKDYADMTPKEKGAFVMSLYNNAAAEYVWMFNTRKDAEGKLSKDDIAVLTKYWKALDTTHQAITVYELWIQAGTVPTQEMEDELIRIIRTLSALAER